jgi:hypothetical protein
MRTLHPMPLIKQTLSFPVFPGILTLTILLDGFFIEKSPLIRKIAIVISPVLVPDNLIKPSIFIGQLGQVVLL